MEIDVGLQGESTHSHFFLVLCYKNVITSMCLLILGSGHASKIYAHLTVILKVQNQTLCIEWIILEVQWFEGYFHESEVSITPLHIW